MVEMKKIMGTKVDATIFRKLRELHYLRSYSHRGKYYTVPEVVRFDAKELWSCRAVHFSKQGSLLNAIAHHVDRSVSGYFEYEIESLLHVTVKVAVLKLLKENRISRQKVAGRYLYCSSRMRKRNRQYNDRKKHQIIKDSTLESMSSEMVFQEGKTLVELFLSLLDEKQRRLFAGLESIKLGGFNEQQCQALVDIQNRLWNFYSDLKSYKENSCSTFKKELEEQFDQLFTTRTCFASLNLALQRIYKNKSELLLVLQRPEIPLHNNLSENDIRGYVKKKKISGGTRSEVGRRCRDTFSSLKKTCRKLGISFWDYLKDRLSGSNTIPQLSDCIRHRVNASPGC